MNAEKTSVRPLYIGVPYILLHVYCELLGHDGQVEQVNYFRDRILGSNTHDLNKIQYTMRAMSFILTLHVLRDTLLTRYV